MYPTTSAAMASFGTESLLDEPLFVDESNDAPASRGRVGALEEGCIVGKEDVEGAGVGTDAFKGAAGEAVKATSFMPTAAPKSKAHTPLRYKVPVLGAMTGSPGPWSSSLIEKLLARLKPSLGVCKAIAI